jgi:hypothetical protein
MTKRSGRGHGYGYGYKNKRTMRRIHSHSAHLTRSRSRSRRHRYQHGSRSRSKNRARVRVRRGVSKRKINRGMRERVMKGGVLHEFLPIPEEPSHVESEQPQPQDVEETSHVETLQDSSMSTLYGGIIFNTDGSFELTPEFLAFFGLHYNDDKTPIRIQPFTRVETFVRKQVDDSFRKLFFNTTNERRVIIDKRLKGTQKVWTLSWQHTDTDTTSNTPIDSKQRYLVTTTDSDGFVTKTTDARIVRVVKQNVSKLALYVTTAENKEGLNFQCNDTATYPTLYFENDESIDTSVYSELIRWNDDRITDTCFKSLRIFSMFIILLTIVNAKETDMKYKVKNARTKEVETKNFKTDCPFVLIPLAKRLADAAARRANAPKSIEERRELASDEINQAIQNETLMDMSWKQKDEIEGGIIRRICHKYNLDHDSECNRKLWHGWFK